MRRMATIELAGKMFDVDEDGFLQNPELWDDDVAKAFAPTTSIGMSFITYAITTSSSAWRP